MRIDKLQPGSIVTLALFHNTPNPYEDTAMFMGIEGEGDDRRAKFITICGDGRTPNEWEAYRYCGRWVWGSSADSMRLVEVKHTPAELLR